MIPAALRLEQAVSVASMVLMESANLLVAPPTPDHLSLNVVPNMAVATEKRARWKVAALLLQHVVSVASMVPMVSASLMDAPPTPYHLSLNFAGNTAVATKKYARWKDATLLLNHTVSA